MKEFKDEKKLKLSQIIAISSNEKGNKLKKITDVYQGFKNDSKYDGLTRTYQPFSDEDVDKLPPENKLIESNLTEELKTVFESLSSMLDVCVTQDIGNMYAKADIIVNDKCVASDVPAV